MRKTQARQAIIEVLRAAGKPISAKEIGEAVSRGRPDLNKSTVYRFIKSLLASEQLVAISLPGRGAVYELRSERGHHHFTCERCHTVVCLKKTGLELRKVVPKGYAVSAQNVVLSGLCPDCS